MKNIQMKHLIIFFALFLSNYLNNSGSCSPLEARQELEVPKNKSQIRFKRNVQEDSEYDFEYDLEVKKQIRIKNKHINIKGNEDEKGILQSKTFKIAMPNVQKKANISDTLQNSFQNNSVETTTIQSGIFEANTNEKTNSKVFQSKKSSTIQPKTAKINDTTNIKVTSTTSIAPAPTTTVSTTNLTITKEQNTTLKTFF
jgi:hypothetical protein